MPLQAERDARDEKERRALQAKQDANPKAVAPPPGLSLKPKGSADVQKESPSPHQKGDSEDDTRSLVGEAVPPRAKGKSAEKQQLPHPGPSEGSEPDVDIRLDLSIPGIAEVVAYVRPGDVAGSGEHEFSVTTKWLRALKECISEAQSMASRQPHVSARSAVSKMLAAVGIEDNKSLFTILGTVAATISSITSKNRAEKVDGLAAAVLRHSNHCSSNLVSFNVLEFLLVLLPSFERFM